MHIRAAKCTHGSKTKRVMYSRGIRGSWWEKTFFAMISHKRTWSDGSLVIELFMTWNVIRPRFCSLRAVSSRDACALNKEAFDVRHV